MIQFGIMVKNLGPSELNWRLLNNANNLMYQNQANITFFYEDVHPYCVNPMGSVMQMVEAYEYKYPLIATCISNAQKLLDFPRRSESYFYLWDLEWLRYPNTQFELFKSVYNNPNIELVARTNEHKFLIQELWNNNIKKVCEKANPLEILSKE